MLMLMPPRIHPQVVMSNAIRNLSSNFLEGTLPSGLGQESLARLGIDFLILKLIQTLAVYSIPANRPVTVFHSGPLIPFPNHPGQPHRRRISPTPATLSGEFFRRPLFRAPTTYSEPPEADLHASGNPTGNWSLTRPYAPIFPVGLSPTRRRVTARGSLSGHVRHLSRLVRRRLGLLALRQSSTSPASPLFFLFLAFLPFRPHLTGLPLHLRGLGAASLPL
ncbi:hypothetical protein CK203_034925 [Vitis vinifera]|uniref:Uncharacterized protein n=1 Tax=Vitis vinifera TaxID=29760 RepID=A0A438FYP6_VITVI|nr:hypothetical protein CK203_034925 [Vitis vinifera]